MGDDITIGVTEIVNNIEVTAQPNDQIIDISVVDNTDEVTLNITPTVIEINVNKGSSYAKWGTILGTLSDQEDLQDALDLKADLVDGKVPSSQLPSYVDDVIEVANYAALPTVGESGKIYITLDDNHIFRWTGSTYVEITDNTAVWGAITGTLSSQTDLSTALNAKALKTTTISTNAPLSGGGDLSANRTLSISQASASVDGYLSSTDWNTFNNKLSSLSGAVLTTTNQTVAGEKKFQNTQRIDSETLFKQNASYVFEDGYTTIAGRTNGILISHSLSKAAVLDLSGLTTPTKTFSFPNASGTFALTSDLSSYALDNSVVKLTGDQTVAGIKTFSSDVKSTAFRLTGGTTGTGLYYGHTNKVVLANYTVGGGIDFETNGGAVNMILNGNGNLGIGVDPSDWDSLWKVLQLSYGSLYSSIYSNIMAHNLYVAGEDTKYISSNLASQYEQNSGAHWWSTAPTGTAGANMTLTPRMTLDNDGKLGIGITSPTDILHLNRSGSGVYNAIHWTNPNSTADFYVGIGGSSASNGSLQNNAYLYNAANSAIVIATNDTERMRITSGGATKMSNDGTYLNSTASYHEMRQSVNNTNIALFTNTTASPYGPSIYFPSASPNNTTNYFLAGSDTSGNKFFIWSNGSIVNSTGSYGTISDIKYKENIIDASSKLDDILQLKVRNFNFIGDETKQIGFIAQEFEEVFPSMVDVTIEKEEEGKEPETYKSIKTSVLTPILVKAMQELAEQVKEVKAEIELLKAK